MTDNLPNKSLNKKLLSISFTVIMLAMILLVLVFTTYSNQQTRSDLVKDLQVLSAIMGNRSAAALVFNDRRQASSNLESAQFRDGIIKACIYDSFRNLFAHYQPTAKTCPSSLMANTDILISSEYIEVHQPIIESDETLGFISLYAEKRLVNETLHRSILTWLITFVVVLLFAFWMIRRRIDEALSPLNRLNEVATRVSTNPFSEERAVAVAEDEVGHLVHVFNAMLDTLSRENTALQDSKNRFRSLAQNAPIGIYQIDTDHEFIYTNKKWHELTGLPFVGALKDYVKFAGDVEENLHQKVIEKARINKEPQLLEYSYHFSETEQPRVFMEHIAPIFSLKDGSECTGFIGSLMDISELKNAQMELETLAFYDPLTNLPNRRFFLDYLGFTIADGELSSLTQGVIMMDIDNFKKVNDTLGHDAGDEMLKAIAGRLRSLLAKKDIVCRLGGDEFIILVKDADSINAIRTIAERTLDTIRQPLSIRGHDINASCSMGIAVFPEDGKTSQDLMRNADLALYLSKEKGKNRSSFFSRELETTINEKVKLEAKLRDALKNDHLTFFMQPKLCMKSGRLMSAEVLIRWIDPVDGMIGPDRFIPIAEETGLIISIGDWLVESVLSSVQEHRLRLEQMGITGIAINLSARQFYSNTLVTSLQEAFERYDIEPEFIEFELTESSVIEDIELAISIMHSIKALGCRISIDDFGTGYSSLSYLKRFPIDAVKIDRSFISDIPHDKNDVEIASAIIAMGHSLGLKIVAEGVETSEQLNFLQTHQCDFAQGYHISKPMPMETLLKTFDDLNSAVNG